MYREDAILDFLLVCQDRQGIDSGCGTSWSVK